MTPTCVGSDKTLKTPQRLRARVSLMYLSGATAFWVVRRLKTPASRVKKSKKEKNNNNKKKGSILIMICELVKTMTSQQFGTESRPCIFCLGLLFFLRDEKYLDIIILSAFINKSIEGSNIQTPVGMKGRQICSTPCNCFTITPASQWKALLSLAQYPPFPFTVNWVNKIANPYVQLYANCQLPQLKTS